MHIHELNPWRTLIAVSTFVVILVIGFVTMPKPLFEYQKSMDESIEALLDGEDYFYPWELEEVIANKPDSIVLFDIRDNFVFGQGHIPGAENLSANTLADPDNLERLTALRDRGVTVVLYGENELQGNGPWMFFRQVGFNNIKLLLGGYEYYKANEDDLYNTINDDAYFSGFPRFNYAEMAAPQNGSDLNSDQNNKPVQVRRREKTSVAAGGC